MSPYWALVWNLWFFLAIGRLSPHTEPVIRGMILNYDGSPSTKILRLPRTKQLNSRQAPQGTLLSSFSDRRHYFIEAQVPLHIIITLIQISLHNFLSFLVCRPSMRCLFARGRVKTWRSFGRRLKLQVWAMLQVLWPENKIFVDTMISSYRLNYFGFHWWCSTKWLSTGDRLGLAQLSFSSAYKHSVMCE